MVPLAELHFASLESPDCCGASLAGIPSCAGSGVGDDLPADIRLSPFRGSGEHDALFRSEHAGRRVAALPLKFLDGVGHAIADIA